MTITEQINRLQQAKRDMKAAINNKGVAIADSEKLDVYAERIGQISTEPSYVYKCTGNADDVAISNLVNCFLNATGEFTETTALTMKLVVSGNVGLSETPAFGTGADEDNIARYFNFVSGQTRGARVYIDWSNAQIPEITKVAGTTAVVYHGGSGSTICHHGLAIKVNCRCCCLLNNSTGIVYIDNGYLSYNFSGGGYSIWNHSTGKIYINNSYCYNMGATIVMNRFTGVIYIDNSYLYVENSSGYGVMNSAGSMYMSNTYCYCYCTAYGYGVYNSKGIIYITNSYIFSHGGSSYAVHNSSTGTVYINNSYCLAHFANGSYAGVGNTSTGTIYISNSYCCGNLDSGSSAWCYGVLNKSAGTVYISNGYCFADGSGSGVGNHDIGTVYISSSLCMGASVYAGISSMHSGYGLWLDNVSEAGYGKVIAMNSCFRGYRHVSNTSGVGYGVGTTTDTRGEYNMIVLIGCKFDRKTITDMTQTGDVKLGTSSTIVPKYHITGNTFYSANVSIGGSNITHNGNNGVMDKYLPINANFFNVTT